MDIQRLLDLSVLKIFLMIQLIPLVCQPSPLRAATGSFVQHMHHIPSLLYWNTNPLILSKVKPFSMFAHMFLVFPNRNNRLYKTNEGGMEIRSILMFSSISVKPLSLCLSLSHFPCLSLCMSASLDHILYNISQRHCEILSSIIFRRVWW